ncbi:hypothetical protein WICMUC_005718 [Wickerhamomyces mucosus]|uniref:Uncharacterized protein n=1 Tax=Wickerhamomyces mucosus TaxID=1378264 RepID=A0A9P8P2G5_9ASCO|nr:hypothetical protein WICMUC_005718 [Wickerhamomyces mucosus]
MTSISFNSKVKSPLSNDFNFEKNLINQNHHHFPIDNIDNNKNSKNIDTNYEIPQLKFKPINKELETKKIIINFFILLLSNLIYKYLELILNNINYFENLSWIFHNNNNIIIIIFEKLFQNFNKFTILFRLLIGFNILNSSYKLIFQNNLKYNKLNNDKDLTIEQRKLLGLPINQLINDNIINKPINKLDNNINKPINKLDININNNNKQKLHKTPIASPMSSPQLQKKKKNVESIDSINPNSNLLNKNLNLNTPTYIPSPKYYYRMDSPSRTRRRV